VQIVRTLGELGYCDRELTPYFIIGGDEVYQDIILIGIEGCQQIETILSVFISLMQDSRIKAFFFSMEVFYSLGAVKCTVLGKLQCRYVLRVWLVSKQRAAWICGSPSLFGQTILFNH